MRPASKERRKKGKRKLQAKGVIETLIMAEGWRPASHVAVEVTCDNTRLTAHTAVRLLLCS
jgi:hypothetical protein